MLNLQKVIMRHKRLCSAFDTVDHTILLRKLSFGVTSNSDTAKWFESNLNGRMQFTSAASILESALLSQTVQKRWKHVKSVALNDFRVKRAFSGVLSLRTDIFGKTAFLRPKSAH